MHMYTHARICVHTHVYTHTHTNIYIYIYIYIYIIPFKSIMLPSKIFISHPKSVIFNETT